MLSINWNRISGCYTHADILLGQIRIAHIGWHYRAGKNSMYCLFTVHGGEYFFSKTPEAVLAKFEQEIGMKVKELTNA